MPVTLEPLPSALLEPSGPFRPTTYDEKWIAFRDRVDRYTREGWPGFFPPRREPRPVVA